MMLAGRVCGILSSNLLFLGDTALHAQPKGQRFLTFPGHYTISLIPRTYKKLRIKAEPCTDVAHPAELDPLLWQSLGKWCKRQSSCVKPTYDVRIGSDLVYRNPYNDTTIDHFCINFHLWKHMPQTLDRS